MKRWALAQHAVFHTLLRYFFFSFRFETPPHVFCSFCLSFLLVASSASYFRIIRPRLFFFFFLSFSIISSHPLIRLCHSHLVRLSSITLCKIESLCGLRQSILVCVFVST